MTSFSPSRPVSWLQVYPRVTSAWALLLGGVMALAWVFMASFPQAPGLGVATLNPHTALGLVVAGVALWLKQAEAVAGQGKARERGIANLCAATLVLTGLLTLGRHVFGLGPHADRILTGEVFRVLQTPTRGRMEINTALNLVFLGTALVLIKVETRRGIRPAQLLALGAGLVSFLGIIGYVDGARPQHGVAAYLLGLVSAATFAALSIAVLLTHPHRGLMQVITSPGVGGVVARRFLIYVLVITVLLAALDQAGERLGLYKSRLDSLLFILSINGLLTVLIWLHARSLNRVDVIRHEAEARIERSRAMLAQAEQLAHLGSWEWDLQTRQFSCSEELDQIFGLTGEGLDGGYGAYLERIHAEDRERVRALFEGALPERAFVEQVMRALTT